MKCQVLFSLKKEKKYFKMFADIVVGTLRLINKEYLKCLYYMDLKVFKIFNFMMS